ncbi:MBL fold metallo-hydrolase [Myxococcota bacterium]|nr:MBL fold metallo-hydrolase [Myxococcota bacterium]
MSVRLSLLLSVVLPGLLTACVVTRHPVTPAQVPAATQSADLIALLNTPGPIVHSAHLSARWSAKLSGLVNLDDPQAVELKDGDTPIVLPVHRLVHPSAGVFVVDSGVERDTLQGGRGPARGAVTLATKSVVPVEPLGDILASAGAPIAGVLITHMHLDHLLGLQDVPPGTPIYVGAGETTATGRGNRLLRRTVNAALDGHAPLRELDGVGAVPLGPIAQAYDLVGDGSLWALSTPGHTPGSMSYLARTTEGPVLFTGDTCHTIWGWEHNVTPGSFTSDQAMNAKSLSALKALAELLPGVTVYVGHELDGEGTGVDG